MDSKANTPSFSSAKPTSSIVSTLICSAAVVVLPRWRSSGHRLIRQRILLAAARLSGIRSQAIPFETRLSNGSIPESRHGHTKGLEPGDMGEMPTLPS